MDRQYFSTGLKRSSGSKFYLLGLPSRILAPPFLSPYATGGGTPPRPSAEKMWRPLDVKFKLYLNHCHRNPVHVFFINMRNQLFRLLILFDVFDELQFIY